MLDWNEYRKQLMSRVGELGKLAPDTVSGYQALSLAGKKPLIWMPKLVS